MDLEGSQNLLTQKPSQNTKQQRSKRNQLIWTLELIARDLGKQPLTFIFF
jgi:hypothetical protein